MRHKSITCVSSIEEFWSLIRDTESGCWEWTGSLGSKGYGRLKLNGDEHAAHRLSLSLTLGRKLERWEFACHSCDNRPCIRPSHIFLGSPLANIQDAMSKGRMSCQDPEWQASIPKARGAKNTNAKLTDDLVREIRYRSATEDIANAELGRQYNVSKVLIGLILKRKIWTHVEDKQ